MFEFLKATYVIRSVAAIFVTWLLLKLLSSYLRRRRFRLPPGPVALPLVGPIGNMDHVTLFNHRDKYGDISYMRVVGNDTIILNSVEVIRDGFQSPATAETFSARPAAFSIEQNGIIFRSMDADNWKPLRQVFHTLLKQYGEGIDELETVVTRELEVLIGEFSEKVGQDINVAEYTKPSLINILSILALGERYERDHWIMKILLDIMKMGNPVRQPFAEMLLKALPFLMYLPVGPGAMMKKLYLDCERWMTFAYRDRKSMSSDELKSQTGVVYEMMKLQEKNSWLTDSMIEGVLGDLYGAGFITTDASLRSFFLLLLHHSEVQTKIQNEIDEVVGWNRKPYLSDRPNMPYTVATIHELMRYFSISPLAIAHVCTKETTFRGYTVPRNAAIIPNLFRVHHDPELWENPWTFDPTRFLDENGDVLPASHERRRNLIPFGVGKRVCLGEVFAKTRIFLYITYLLQTFSFKPSGVAPSCDPRQFFPGLVLDPPSYSLKMERRIWNKGEGIDA